MYCIHTIIAQANYVGLDALFSGMTIGSSRNLFFMVSCLVQSVPLVSSASIHGHSKSKIKKLLD